MLLASVLLLATPLQDGCGSTTIETFTEDDEDKLHQAHGKGLWIGGIAFVPTDIMSAIAKESDFLPEDWQIEIVFSAAGSAKFTTAQRCGVGVPLEISLDAKLMSRPTLNEPILGPSVMISGGFTQESAVEFAEKIRASAAP